MLSGAKGDSPERKATPPERKATLGKCDVASLRLDRLDHLQQPAADRVQRAWSWILRPCRSVT